MDSYVQQMLHRALKSLAYSKSKPPTAKQTRRWLIYLAQQLSRWAELFTHAVWVSASLNPHNKAY